jgi:hypothetical protein
LGPSGEVDLVGEFGIFIAPDNIRLSGNCPNMRARRGPHGGSQ